MSSVEASGNSSLEAISGSYKQKTEEEDPLGKDAFLTMLVAQLENQDPLNPMDGTDFTAQLAQYSQLEQQFNTNDNLEAIRDAIEKSAGSDSSDYMGKDVIGEVNTLEVNNGTPVGGYYNLDEAASVMITITDSEGTEVRTIYPGQMEEGSHDIGWDGTDNDGKAVMDGTYNYTVLANNGTGYTQVQTTVSGRVDAVIFKDGKSYLQVDGSIVSPENIIKVMEPSEDPSSAMSPVDYLGRDIQSSQPFVSVQDGQVSGSGFTFNMERADDLKVTIFDAAGNEIRTIDRSADDAEEGENTVGWDGKDAQGKTVADGVYGYVVRTRGAAVDTGITATVDGISYKNGKAYLHTEDGYLVDPATISNVR